MEIWVVYDHPQDYPDFYIARKFYSDRPTHRILKSQSLTEIREILKSKGLRAISEEGGDPVIIESWI